MFKEEIMWISMRKDGACLSWFSEEEGCILMLDFGKEIVRKKIIC